jgi:glycosyltransferase involved in cell wall biosynthesis
VVKIAFITPRYGAEIVSGPEHACRLLAEQLTKRHDVDVITTTARDSSTWKNEYSEGSDRVRGVLVRRFAVNQMHDSVSFGHFSSRLFSEPHGHDDEREWIRRLGPMSPGLQDFLKRQHRSYDALVFFSLIHPTTVHGMTVAPERSVLFPCLQLHPSLRFGIWHDVLGSVRAIGYMSPVERRLARGFFRGLPQGDDVVGIGVDIPSQQTYPRHQQNPEDAITTDEGEAPVALPDEASDYLAGRGVPFRRRNRLYGPFALYGGRVECNNGCEEMLEYFDTYASTDGDTSLVLMGLKLMKVPDERYIRVAGTLPDRERMIAYEAADVTVAPDPDDLLAQPVLESLAVGTPVLASARNTAAVDLCRRAGGGLYYANREEFVEAMRLLMTNTRLRQRLGESGRQYVRLHFRWDAVLGRFERVVMRVRSRQ